MAGKETYDLLVSLGAGCGCSMWLRGLDLQFRSYPFDWLAHAGFQPRVNLLLNDFDGLCDSAHYIPAEKPAGNDSHCDFYEHAPSTVRFYHEFAEGKPLTETFPAFADRYARRIARLDRDVRAAGRVLFIWLSHWDHTPDHAFLDAQKALSAKYGKNIYLLVIENDPAKKGTDALQKRALSPFVTRFALDTLSGARDPIVGNEKRLRPLFKTLRMRMPPARRIWLAVKSPLLEPLAWPLFRSAWKKRFFKKFYKERGYRQKIRRVL